MGFSTVEVGGSRYSVQKMNPMDALDFGVRVMTVVSPALGGIMEAVKEGGSAERDLPAFFSSLQSALSGGNAAAILKEALRRCFTPQNEGLADDVVFDKWFREHPGDMFPLAARAVWELVKDFLPPTLITRAAGISSKPAAKAL